MTAAVVPELGGEVDVDFAGAAVGNRLAAGITVRLAGRFRPVMEGQPEGSLYFECGGLEVRGVRRLLAEFRVEHVHAGFPKTELVAQGFKVVVGESQAEVVIVVEFCGASEEFVEGFFTIDEEIRLSVLRVGLVAFEEPVPYGDQGLGSDDRVGGLAGYVFGVGEHGVRSSPLGVGFGVSGSRLLFIGEVGLHGVLWAGRPVNFRRVCGSALERAFSVFVVCWSGGRNSAI